MVLVYLCGGNTEDKAILFQKFKKAVRKNVEVITVHSWPKKFPNGNIHEWRKICSEHYHEVRTYLEEDHDKVWVLLDSIIDILDAGAPRFDESTFTRLIEQDEINEMLQSCQSSPVFYFQRTSSKNGDNLHWLLDWLYISNIKVYHSAKTVEIMADAFKRFTYPLDIFRFNRKNYKPEFKRTNFLFFKPPRKEERRTTMRSINITSENEYTNDWVIFPEGYTNRFLSMYPSAQFQLVQFYFHVRVRSEIVQRLLQEGVTVNGSEYSFLGCSSEGLKLRKCLLWNGDEKEVQSIINKCGDFNENSVSKRMARFGLMFSELMLTKLEIPKELIVMEDDIESDCRRYNFTDGCGSISYDMAKKVTEEIKQIKEADLDPQNPPSVFKIRLQGFKGVLALDRSMNNEQIKLRPSMIKFKTVSLPRLGICDYSKPFTFGNLNRQYVTLLAGLGVKDEVFERLQKHHFQMVRQMCCDIESAVCVLRWRTKSELAGVLIDMFEENLLSLQLTETEQVQKLSSTAKETFRSKLKELTKNLKTEQADIAVRKGKKIKILVPKSRYIFGVCDPYGILEYGECFIRLTSAKNRHENIHGPVVICKPPCYLKGDIRVLRATTDLEKPELSKLKHLVDCIVFPVKGPRPHPNEIAGSDLDGDKFFVSWEASLIPPNVVEPYDYPAAETPPDGAPTIDKMIRYFSTQNKAQEMTGKVDSYYRKWSDIEGPNSEKCKQLAMRFSRVIDAAKTGANSQLPEALKPNLDDESRINHAFIWNKLENAAKEFRDQVKEGIITQFKETDIFFEKDLASEILSESSSKLGEYDKFRFAWRLAEQFREAETTADQFLHYYAEYIDFSKFTQKEKRQAWELGVPEHIIVNAMNMSHLLTEGEVGAFSSHACETPWVFYFRKKSKDINWPMLTKALTSYDNSCLVIGLPNEMILVIQFYYKLKQGVDQEISPGTVSAMFFSRNFDYKFRHIIGSDYELDFTNDILQIYRNKSHTQSFVWLKTSGTKPVKIKSDKSLHLEIDENVNCLSVDLSRFNKQIYQNNRQHPLITKTQLSAVEVFVRNESHNAESPQYYDVKDTDGDMPYVIETELDETPEQEFDGDLLALLDQDVGEGVKILIDDEHEIRNDDVYRKLLSASEHCNFNEIEALLMYIEKSNVNIDVYHCFVTLLECFIRKTTARIVPTELVGKLESINICVLNKLTLGQRIEIAELLFRANMNDEANQVLISDTDTLSTKDFIQIVESWQLFWVMEFNEAVQYLDGVTKNTMSDIYKATDKTEKLHYIVHVGRLHCLEMINSIQILKSQMETNPLRTTASSVTNLRLDVNTNKEEAKTISLYASKALPYVPKVYLGQFVLICRHGDTKRGLKPTNFTFIGKIVNVMNAPFSVQIELLDPVPDVIRVSMNSERQFPWLITVIANVVTYSRVFEALKELLKDSGKVPLFPVLANSKPFHSPFGSNSNSLNVSSDKNTNGGGGASPEPADVTTLYKRDQSAASGPSLQKIRNAVSKREELDYASKTLDRDTLDNTQFNAVQTALSKQITCINGPPGTGKSKVACEIVNRVLQMKKYSRVLVVAETNNAVDNLARLLRKTNLIVRIGPSVAVARDLYEITLESQVKQIENEVCRHDVSDNVVRNAELCHQVIETSSVVMATCSAVGDPILKRYRFEFVVVDEASIVLETTLLCSLVKGCKQLVLLGDTMQLSPFINQQTMTTFSHDGLPDVSTLSETLFHRLSERSSSIPNIQLQVQYRMHEKLLTFPSNQFYDGSLQCAESVQSFARVPFLWPDSSTPICFIHTNGRDEKMGSSFYNTSEAKLVSDVVNKLLYVRDEDSTECGKISVKQITVLTFYQAQVKCIKDQLKDRVAVNTVDGFQGCENDVIVASTVRANKGSTVGFSGEQKRLNVLFTRAKRGLIVIGDERTLCKSEIWQKWLDCAPRLDEGEVKIVDNKSKEFKIRYEKPYTDTVVGRKARRNKKYR